MFACIYIPKPAAEAAQADAADAALLECANAFSPRIESTWPGTVVFDLEGLERLFGSYCEIAAKVAGQAAARGLHANVGVAANVDAAICAARGFPGITVLSRGSEAQRLAGLPLEVLAPFVDGSGPAGVHSADVQAGEILETLHRWGIRTLGSLAKLPAVQVSERLGQQGVRLHKLARGTGSRPLIPHLDPLQFVETMDLDYEITAIEPLTFILSRMLDGICARLRRRDLATHEIHLSLSGLHSLRLSESDVRVLRLPLPVRNPRLLTKLLILDLEAHPPGVPVQHIGVEAIPAKPRVVQTGLFVPLSPEPEKLELTLARLAAVVGEENVGSPEVLDSHRPDAFRVNHFTRGVRGLFREGTIRGAISSPPQTGARTPFSIRFFRPPLEATVQTRNGIPHWIAFHGVHGPIETSSGAWRTSGDWWRPDTWDREEWDIEVRDALYRIYYDVHTDRWFVQGIYD